MAFNGDIIFEILSRTSDLKTLDGSIVVSKEWKEIIEEASFLPLHGERTGTVRGYFVEGCISSEVRSRFVCLEDHHHHQRQQSSCNAFDMSLKFLPEKVNIKACTKQGLLCCVSNQSRRGRFYVCKPATKQWRALPNPKTRFFTVKLGMIVLRSHPLRYKILRLSSLKHYSYKSLKFECFNLHCEIFDSDTWRWTQLIKDIELPLEAVGLSREPVVIVNGVMHWRMYDDQILAFDVDVETYTLFGLSQTIRKAVEDKSHYRNKQLVAYKGQLALIYVEGRESVRVWVMEDYKRHVWRNSYEELDIKAITKNNNYPRCRAFYNTDIAIMMYYYKVLFYKFQSGSVLNQVHLPMYPSIVFPFRSDSKLVYFGNRV